MPNWCFNSLILSGDADKIEQVRCLFDQMHKKQSANDGNGQFPDFLTPEQVIKYNGDWFFDLDKRTDAYDNINYTSRWTPNIEVMVVIANHFGVSFELEYEESMMNVVGIYKYNFDTKQLFNKSLDENDFELIEPDEETGECEFEGKTYGETELQEIILERKELVPIEFNGSQSA